MLCAKKKGGTWRIQLGMCIKDDTSSMDVLCVGKVAENYLGITAQEIMENSSSFVQNKVALHRIQELMKPGDVKYKGEIRSKLGNDDKQYFILNSLRPVSSSATTENSSSSSACHT